MRNALFVALVMALLASACMVAPAPTAQVVERVVVVTATPKPSVVQPTTKTSDEAHRLAASLPYGWFEDGPPTCPDDATCYFNESVCSYIMFHEDGSDVWGMSYGVDFKDSNCSDGGEQSDAQFDALMALGAQDAMEWMAENVPSESWDGTAFSSRCGSWTCSLEMDEDFFLMLRVWFE
jgi:hypothetical protein